MTTRRTLAFSFLDRYAGLIVAIVSSMLLARLLTPTQIGVFSVAQALLSYIRCLRDLGAGQYLLQEKDLTRERIRATWTVQLGLGVTFAVIVLVAASPVAAFYHEAILRDILLVLAVNFAIGPFGSLTYAWLMREMRFDLLAIMRFTGGVAGAGTSVGLAWLGFGPISLAFGSLAATIVNAVVALLFRPVGFPWLPGLKEIKRVLAFGGQITVVEIINTMASSIAELTLGKVQGMTATGLYSRANGLASMFSRLVLDATTAVALPLFARARRNNDDFGKDFIRATSYVTAIGWAFFFGIVFLAQPLIRLLYGTQWSEAVQISRLLAIAMAIGLPVALCRIALTAAGSVRAVLHASVINAAQLVTFTAIGASLGLIELGIACILVNIGSTLIWISFTYRRINLSLKLYGRTLAISGAVALISALAPATAYLLFDPAHDGVVRPLILGGMGGVVLFVMASLWFNHPISEEIRRVNSKLKRHLM